MRLWTQLGGVWQFNDYTYKASGGPTKAAMVLPVPGTALFNATATFAWSPGTGGIAYELYVGSTPGGFNYFGQNVGPSTGQAVSGLPNDGSTIYVRLWTLLGGTWQFTDYTYKASGGVPAALIFPVQGTQLNSTTVVFD